MQPGLGLRALGRTAEDQASSRHPSVRTREERPIDWDELTRAYSEVDIVVSERRLPKGCNPRWLKLDPETLTRMGGLTIYPSSGPHVDSVADRIGHHPWAQTAP